MRTRHLAVVLLEVLWFLLTPPLGKDGRINTAAPLAHWHRSLAFSVEGSCADELQSEIGRAARNPATTPSSFALLKASICIAGDDPRLGGAASKPSY